MRFPGIATTFSDSVPVLFLPLGHARDQAQVFPMFHASRTYASVTKQVEHVLVPEQMPAAMRRAFSALKNGRPGPVMVELPRDLLALEIGSDTLDHSRLRRTRSAPDPQMSTTPRSCWWRPVPGDPGGPGRAVRRGERRTGATGGAAAGPVMTTVDGKSAFPEDHALALGSGGNTFTGHGRISCIRKADLILAIGTGLTGIR